MHVLPDLLGGLAFLGSFLAFLLAVATTLAMASLAWIWYRPNYGLPIFISALLLLVLVAWVGDRRRRQTG